AASEKVGELLVVELADVTRPEGVAPHGEPGQVRALEVAAEQHGGLADDFSGLSAAESLAIRADDLDFDPRRRLAHGLELDPGGAIMEMGRNPNFRSAAAS